MKMPHSFVFLLFLGATFRADAVGVHAAGESHHSGLHPRMRGAGRKADGVAPSVGPGVEGTAVTEQAQFETDLERMEGLLHDADGVDDGKTSQQASEKKREDSGSAVRPEVHRNQSLHHRAVPIRHNTRRKGSVPTARMSRASSTLTGSHPQVLTAVLNASVGKVVKGDGSSLVKGLDSENVKRELFSLKKQCKVKKVQDLISDIEEIVEGEVRPRIEEQHRSAQELLNSVAAGFQGCLSSRNSLDGEVTTMYSAIPGYRTSHQTCRTIEHTETQETHTCETTVTSHEQAVTAACSWSFTCGDSAWQDYSSWNCNGDEPPPMDDMAEQCHTSDQEDQLTRLQRMKVWFDQKVLEFNTREEECTTATETWQTVQTQCTSQQSTSTSQRTVCDNKQSEYEGSVCAYLQASQQQCLTYQSCYEGAAHTFWLQKDNIEQQEIARKSEWTTVLRVQCYLREFHEHGCEADEARILVCDTEAEHTEHLDLVYPEDIPHPGSCEPEQPEPCSPEFRTAEYGSLPSDAQAVDCTPCALIDLTPAACERPGGWCTHSGSTYSTVDCDWDGVPDPFCQDSAGQSGFRGSDTGCTDTWPAGVCETESSFQCERPSGWCSHSGSTYSTVDCDGDGIPDPYCEDSAGSTGFRGSSSPGCTDTWPGGHCQTSGYEQCTRPDGWCSHGGSTFQVLDCDGDGLPDPFCQDTDGQSGFRSSASGCDDTWPSGVCQTDSAQQCERPNGWCTGAQQFSYIDCDGDGVLDPFCQSENGDSGFVGSASNCASTFPSGGCRSAETPPWTPHSCERPDGWCTHGGARYEFADCDGDGLPDPFCRDDVGSIGFRSSSSACADTWPSGSCPGYPPQNGPWPAA